MYLSAEKSKRTRRLFSEEEERADKRIRQIMEEYCRESKELQYSTESCVCTLKVLFHSNSYSLHICLLTKTFIIKTSVMSVCTKLRHKSNDIRPQCLYESEIFRLDEKTEISKSLRKTKRKFIRKIVVSKFKNKRSTGLETNRNSGNTH